MGIIQKGRTLQEEGGVTLKAYENVQGERGSWQSLHVFLDCPKMYSQDFQKAYIFRYFLQILKFRRENFGQAVILS